MPAIAPINCTCPKMCGLPPAEPTPSLHVNSSCVCEEAVRPSRGLTLASANTPLVFPVCERPQPHAHRYDEWERRGADLCGESTLGMCPRGWKHIVGLALTLFTSPLRRMPLRGSTRVSPGPSCWRRGEPLG